jgi:hypothetical protein
MPDAAGSQEPAPSDEFDRELRELTEGRAGDPLFIEPSAAERAGAGGVRVKEAPALPDGTRPRRRRRRKLFAGGGHLFCAVFAAAILLLAGGLAWLRVGHPAPIVPGGAPRAAVAGQPPAAAAATPQQGTISPVDLFDGPPADPFLGTPADGWADGAAGIVAPAAWPAGGFTAAQVAAAYATTRKLLIAAGLDRQTLLGGAPAALARLLIPAQRATFLAGLGKQGVAKNGYPLSTRTWVTSFAPGSAELIGTVIKVHGTMSARAVTESGSPVLAVNVDYLFTYAVQSPHDPTDWTRVVIRQHGSVDFARWDDSGAPGGALEPWDRMVIETGGLQCGPGGGYVYPDYPTDRWVDAEQTRTVIDPYSGASPAAASAACAPAIGP